MPVDFAKVERARAMLHGSDEAGWSRADLFGGLSLFSRLAAHEREQTDPANAAMLRRAHSHMIPLFDDLMSLFSVLLRAHLDFQRRIDKELDDGVWFQFSRQDVEFFILVVRSALDHAAAVIVSSAKTQEWNRVSSFDDLRKDCAHERAIEVLGEDWVRLVRACVWFDDLRTWRTMLAHHGGLALTFFDTETIPFQIHQQGEHKINVPEIMYNEMVVDFTRFAALYMSYLLCLLDDMTRVSMRYLDIGALPQAAIHAGGGVEVFKLWSDRLLALREPSTSAQPTP